MALHVTKPKVPFLEALRARVLLFDGGMGTVLYEKGVFLNHCYEELNLSRPSIIEEVHRAFLQAGSDAIETNTFSGSRPRLETHGLAEKVREVNRAAAMIARRCAGRSAYVAGSVGPLGIRLEPWGKTSIGEAVELFREQISGLVEGGVDLIVCETFSDLVEIQAAIRAAREISDLPILAMMTVDEEGRSPEGVPAAWLVQKLEETAADVVGTNCSVGPAPMLGVIETMAGVAKRPLAAMPNAGTPRGIDGRMLYVTSPMYMGRYSRRFTRAGARIVGGCCGVLPEHIRAMRDALGADAGREAVPRVTMVPPRERPVDPVPRAMRSHLAGKIAAGTFVVVTEVTPPRGCDVSETSKDVRRAIDAGLDGVLVLDDPRLSGRMSGIALSRLILDLVAASGSAGCEFEPLLQFMARDRRLPSVVSELLGAHALGIRNVMPTTGRAPRPGESSWEIPVFDVDAIGLTNVVHRLNHGLDVGDNAIGEATSFHTAVLATIGAQRLDEEIKRLEWKIDAGADLIVTSPVFDVDELATFLRRIDSVRVAVLATIIPLRSTRHAEYLAGEVPGLNVPEAVLSAMKDRSEPEAFAEGLRIAGEILAAVRPLVEGITISGPRATDPDVFGAFADVIGSEVGSRREFPGRPGILGGDQTERHET